MKIIGPGFGLFSEFLLEVVGHRLVITPYKLRLANGEFNGQGRLFHTTMYSFFVLSGIVDLLTLRLKLPKRTSIIMCSLAFFMEGIFLIFI